jgi:hypothetical protein
VKNFLFHHLQITQRFPQGKLKMEIFPLLLF